MTFKNSVKKAYRQTEVYKLNRLSAEETKWKRRETIARNKLASIRCLIRKVADDLAHERAERGGYS